jgi:uncharacterized protein YkwD
VEAVGKGRRLTGRIVSTGAALGLLLLAAPTAAVGQEPCADADLQPAADNLERVEAAMVCLLNRERTVRGRAALAVHRSLERSSHAHTVDMTRRSYFAHHERGRPTLVERIRAAGFFKGTYTGLYSENIGFGAPEYATAANMHDAFMYSDSHRRNILFGRFRQVGIGSLIIGPNQAFFPDYEAAVFTIDFGRRYVRRKRRKCVRRPRVESAVEEGTQQRRAVKPRRYCDRRRRR